MVSRRQFLQGNFTSRHAPQRPPWALAEASFVKACTRCGDCVEPCPTRIIVIVRGYPEIDFTRGECTFCGACAAACKDQALSQDCIEAVPWTIRAQVATGCLPNRGIECRVCGDYCTMGAIRFSPRLGGPPLAEVDLGACTGCGACVAPCPVVAISVA